VQVARAVEGELGVDREAAAGDRHRRAPTAAHPVDVDEVGAGDIKDMRVVVRVQRQRRRVAAPFDRPERRLDAGRNGGCCAPGVGRRREGPVVEVAVGLVNVDHLGDSVPVEPDVDADDRVRRAAARCRSVRRVDLGKAGRNAVRVGLPDADDARPGSLPLRCVVRREDVDAVAGRPDHLAGVRLDVALADRHELEGACRVDCGSRGRGEQNERGSAEWD
jgi:hypothetical protein